MLAFVSTQCGVNRSGKMHTLKLIIFSLCLWPVVLHAKDLMKFSTIENSPYSTISEHVMRIAYSRLNIDMSVLDLPAQRAIITANAGEVDGELYRIKNVQLKYKNLIMIPVSIGRLEGIGITSNKDISIKEWGDLSNHQVCYRRGVKFAELGLSHIKARAVNSNKQLFIMLEEKRCDVIVIARITSIPMVMGFIERQKAPLFQSVLQTYPLFHYLHYKNKKLAPKLIKELKKMQQEGLIEQVRSQFIEKMADKIARQ